MDEEKPQRPALKITRQTTLVIPVEKDGKTYYVHALPIPRDVFDLNFQLLTRAFSEIISLGTLGPRVSLLTLRKVAEDEGLKAVVDENLVPEMRRLANVVIPAAQGYNFAPWQTAIDQEMFDDEDAREVDNILCFFMCSWHIAKRNQLATVAGMLDSLGAHPSSFSTPTEYARSLTISTAAETGAQKAAPLSIPV